jgi:thiamine pyrophosphate-dependent acetolactate synthase large subunit-like protein
LKTEQVRYIFGIGGATFLDVLDALYDDREFASINVRHEQAAAFMADGLARVTGSRGVCLVTSGPGATNLLTGVAAAYVAHSPVVALVGGIASEHYHKDAFQELDLVGMFKPVTKLALQITKAHRIPELLQAALRVAMSGRRGPVFVEIPRDVLNEHVMQSQRPLLLVGGGANWAGAGDAVTLSAQLSIPMITAYGRNDAVPNAHPLYVGPLGRAGSPEAAAACKRADVLLVVGSRLGQFTTHFDDRSIRPGTAIVQIDVHAGDIGRYYPVAVGIQSSQQFWPRTVRGRGYAAPGALAGNERNRPCRVRSKTSRGDRGRWSISTSRSCLGPAHGDDRLPRRRRRRSAQADLE